MGNNKQMYIILRIYSLLSQKKSCLSSLLTVYNNHSTKSLNVVHLNFQKVWDKVSHNKSLYTIKQVCIVVQYMNGSNISWATDNKSWRLMDQHKSAHLSLVMSPKISVLGPLLFIIYINCTNDGFNNFNNKFVGAKICILVLSEYNKESLQNDLCKISALSCEWN